MITLPLILGKEYKRTDLHDFFGGNRQGGISSSSKQPIILIFSSEIGTKHGYKDRWLNNDIFTYTGEGQLGDMSFNRGNLALRNHLNTGKRIYLFTQVKKAFVIFMGELELLSTGYETLKDREGKDRIGIIFFLKRKGSTINYSLDDLNSLSVEVGNSKPAVLIPNETERRGLVTSRVGQGAYRDSIIYRWDGKCAVTEFNKREILIASHIVAWKHSSDFERLDVNNGILLSPNYDALFDKHLISFENNGKIILSDKLIASPIDKLGVTGNEKINKFNIDNFSYLDRHRSLLNK